MKPALSSSARRGVLAVALTATVAAVIWVDRRDASPASAATVVAATRETPVTAVRATSATMPVGEGDQDALDLGQLKQRATSHDYADLFNSRSWLPPPPTAQPSKPVAPPLPFTYVGKMIEDGEVTVFLTVQGRNLVAKAGTTIDGKYHIDEVKDGEMVITYLPLGERQTLRIGSIH